ncbi:MAG: lipopolysaccharide assembly protein LapA domain-containing protein [Candidatus Bipolaricaulia bacterium]
MRKIKTIVAIIIGILLVVIIFQNLDTVSTQLLFATVEMPQAALLFLTAIAGFAIGLLGRFTFFKQK